MRLSVTPKQFFRFLCIVIAGLVILSIFSNVMRLNIEFANRTYVKGLLNLIDVDLEANLPSFYSAIALALSAFFLFIISLEHKKRGDGYYRWMGLSLVFAFLSIDEIGEVHEHLIFIMRRMFHFTGFLYYAWVIPYGLGVVSLAILYIRFLAKIPYKTRVGFIVAGFIYVMGAIGIEMISAKIAEFHGEQNGVYYLIITVEEFCEMMGIAYFIYTLLKYIQENLGSLQINLGSPNHTA